MIYTDESILDGRTHKDELFQSIRYIKNTKLNITIEGNFHYFLGINIDSRHDGSIHLTQPHLIYQIFLDLNMG